MASLNEVHLIGNLGKDPKITTTQSGTRIATFSIATSDSWKDKTTGERKERTEWHNVVIYNENLAEIAGKYLKKGARTFVEGELHTRKYTDQAGAERWITEVVLTRFGGKLLLLDKADRAPPAESDYGTTRAKNPAPDRAAKPNFDDDIPF